jgi:hypothetical protein
MSELKQLKIEEFDLVSFVMQIQSAILQGYGVTDKSEEAPMCIGHCYHVIMRESIKPNVVVGKAVFEASIDTTKLQEQLKVGGEIEQMLADSLVVDEKLSTEEFSALANESADLIDKVDNLLVKAEAKHIEATTPVKATPKQTRGKK